MWSPFVKTFSTIVAIILFVIAGFFSGIAISGSTARVEGESMSPTYHSGDLLFGTKDKSKMNHGSVIVFDDDKGWSSGKYLVKRVVAVAGDNLSIDSDGKISVNGSLVDKENGYSAGCKHGKTTMTIPRGSIFVRGDNINKSNDSRHQYCEGYSGYLASTDSIRIIVTKALPLSRLFITSTEAR